MSRNRRSAAQSSNHFHARMPDGSPPSMPDHSADGTDERPPSKTRRKNAMHALQDLGNRLTELPNDKLDALLLPEALADAIRDYRRFTKWEAKRRQMQYIGRLMRDIDPAPIAAKLDSWQHTTRAAVAGFHEAEEWRDKLLAGDDALPALLAAHPSLERKTIADLVTMARAERVAGRAPANARLLFRAIARAIDAESASTGTQSPTQ
jgi:ribosome-associated protein